MQLSTIKRARVVMVAVLVALVVPALTLAGTTRTSTAASQAQQIAALQRTVKAQARQINSLRASLGELAGIVQGSASDVSAAKQAAASAQTAAQQAYNTEECHFAGLLTLDMSFVDEFAIIGGQPASYTGQTAPDNGTCAAAGLTPPSPAAWTKQPAGSGALSPFSALTLLIGGMR